MKWGAQRRARGQNKQAHPQRSFIISPSMWQISRTLESFWFPDKATRPGLWVGGSLTCSAAQLSSLYCPWWLTRPLGLGFLTDKMRTLHLAGSKTPLNSLMLKKLLRRRRVGKVGSPPCWWPGCIGGDVAVEFSRVWARSVEATLLGFPEPVFGVLHAKWKG